MLEFIEAIVISLLLHVPPVVALLRVLLLPSLNVVTPVIAAGSGFTVTVTVRTQPEPTVYVIVVLPAP